MTTLIPKFDLMNGSATPTSAVNRAINLKLAETVSVKDFGATGDGTTDDTTAIQAAINAMILGGNIYFPPGTYKITSTLTKASSFVGPNLIGSGLDSCTLNYSTIAASSPCIQIVGGSGTLGSITIEGFKFIGNSTSTGIQICGQDGVIVNRCYFDTNLYGIWFYNRDSSSFTEYCVAEYCTFQSVCTFALNYSVLNGAVSFNGSGMRNCMVNTIGTVVQVGVGAYPYNAPLSAQIWTSGASSCYLIKVTNNNTPYTYNPVFYGTITHETPSTAPLILGNDAGTLTGRMFYVGTVVGASQYWQRGALKICQQFNSGSSAVPYAVLAPYTVKTPTAISTGGTLTFDLVYGINSQDGGSNSYLLNITLTGTNYRYTHIAAFTPGNGFGGPDVITVIATTCAFNSAGWGASTFSINGSGQLVVTNASGGFSVTATVGVISVGGQITS